MLRNLTLLAVAVAGAFALVYAISVRRRSLAFSAPVAAQPALARAVDNPRNISRRLDDDDNELLRQLLLDEF